MPQIQQLGDCICVAHRLNARRDKHGMPARFLHRWPCPSLSKLESSPCSNYWTPLFLETGPGYLQKPPTVCSNLLTQFSRIDGTAVMKWKQCNDCSRGCKQCPAYSLWFVQIGKPNKEKIGAQCSKQKLNSSLSKVLAVYQLSNFAGTPLLPHLARSLYAAPLQTARRCKEGITATRR